MMDLSHQRIVNRKILARGVLGQEPGGPANAPRCGAGKPPFELASSGVSLIPFWVLWVLSNLLSVGLGMALSAFIGGGA